MYMASLNRWNQHVFVVCLPFRSERDARERSSLRNEVGVSLRPQRRLLRIAGCEDGCVHAVRVRYGFMYSAKKARAVAGRRRRRAEQGRLKLDASREGFRRALLPS